MMRSLYAGVTGLQNHQIRTDVIGNNISNINTNGFKKGRVNFQDMISQTISGASRPTAEKGGTNPLQVGLGMTIASVDTLMYQGSLQTTGKKTDLAIQGEGFFIQRKGDRTFYTRAGNYTVDRDKNLVNPANGLKIQGWNATMDADGNYFIDNAKTYSDIKIPIGDKFEAHQTSEIVYKSNLDSRVNKVQNPDSPTTLEKKNGQVHFSSIDVYDSQGKVHKVEITFVKTGINQWQAKVTMPENDKDIVKGSVRFDVGHVGNVTTETDNKDKINLTFNDKGSITSIAEGTENNPDRISTGDLDVSIVFNLNNGTPGGQEQRIKVKMGSSGNVDGVTQMGSNSTTKAVSQNGYGMGYLESFNIDQNGVITGVYTNGQVRELAQVAMATFINPGGLEKSGENTYIISNNSGIANVGPADSQGRGKVVSGALEMSNVDLAEEFTNMIVTQRGFQANSRIITTSDQMLQELLSLKR